MTLRLSEFRDLLDAALLILGGGAGRVELVRGDRRVRVGRISGLSADDLSASGVASLPIGAVREPAAVSEALMVRAPAIGVVSFRDTRTDRPFVTIGQQITPGQTLAFISALEITTKVVSSCAGVVEEVFVDDGDGVEFNAPLLKIIPQD